MKPMTCSALARRAVEKGLGVKSSLGDRDLLQLVDDRIIVNLPGKRLSDAKRLHGKDVIEYLGVRPDQWLTIKPSSAMLPIISPSRRDWRKDCLHAARVRHARRNYNHLDELRKACGASSKPGASALYEPRTGCNPDRPARDASTSTLRESISATSPLLRSCSERLEFRSLAAASSQCNGRGRSLPWRPHPARSSSPGRAAFSVKI